MQATHGLFRTAERNQHLPLHPCTVDVVPPAVAGLPQALWRGLTFECPQAVRAVLLAEVAPDGHQHLAGGALEVEALAVPIDPAHVMVVVGQLLGLSRRHHQQGQHQGQPCGIHAGGMGPGPGPVAAAAVLPHTLPSRLLSRCFIQGTNVQFSAPGASPEVDLHSYNLRWTFLDVVLHESRHRAEFSLKHIFDHLYFVYFYCVYFKALKEFKEAPHFILLSLHDVEKLLKCGRNCHQ